MKFGFIALTAALMMLAAPAWAGPPEACDIDPTDSDSDGLCDVEDNCSALKNNGGPKDGGGFDPINCDTDGDGYGNACDGDFNNDNVTQVADFTLLFVPDLIAGVDSGIGSDMNCDGPPQVADFTQLFIPQITGTGLPGPSGLSCAGSGSCP